MLIKPKIEIEKFKSDKRKISDHESYLVPPKKKITLSQTSNVTPKGNPRNDKRLSSAFSIFKSLHWKDVALRSPSIKDFKNTLTRMWSRLSLEEQKSFGDSPTKVNYHCVCKRTYEEDNSFMVACDICNKWFHTKCISMENALAESADFYHCGSCFERLFRPLMHFLNHCLLKEQIACEQNLMNQIHQFYNMTKEQHITLRNLVFQTNCNQIDMVEFTDVYVKSKVGLVNTSSNCWLNTCLQLILGTVVGEYLLRPEFENDPVAKCISEIAAYICSPHKI